MILNIYTTKAQFQKYNVALNFYEKKNTFCVKNNFYKKKHNFVIKQPKIKKILSENISLPFMDRWKLTKLKIAVQPV